MTPDKAFENFIKIYTEYNKDGVDFNEADTRAKIIDFILRDCLGWSENLNKREIVM